MKNLIAYMLLSALAINMVPGKNYQRYVSLTGGLIMIMLLVSSVLGIFGCDESELIKTIENYVNASDEIDYSLDDIVKAPETAENFLSDMPDYETAGSEESVKVMLRNVGAELENLDITKDKNGEILRIIAVVELTEDGGRDGEKNDEYAYGENGGALGGSDDIDTLFAQIKEYISEVYNLDVGSIYVVVK